MFCEECGKEIEDDAQYCVHCGHRFVQSPSATPQKKKRFGKGVWIIGGIIILIALTFIFGWIPSFSEPKYDCSVKTGYVTVQNIPTSEAKITLVNTNNKVIKTLYLTSGSQGRIQNICNGRYYIYYEFGQQWNPSSQEFAVLTSSPEHFLDPLDFKGNNYYEVSLVPGSGNARTVGGDYNETNQS